MGSSGTRLSCLYLSLGLFSQPQVQFPLIIQTMPKIVHGLFSVHGDNRRKTINFLYNLFLLKVRSQKGIRYTGVVPVHSDNQ